MFPPALQSVPELLLGSGAIALGRCSESSRHDAYVDVVTRGLRIHNLLGSWPNLRNQTVFPFPRFETNLILLADHLVYLIYYFIDNLAFLCNIAWRRHKDADQTDAFSYIDHFPYSSC